MSDGLSDWAAEQQSLREMDREAPLAEAPRNALFVSGGLRLSVQGRYTSCDITTLRRVLDILTEELPSCPNSPA